MARDLASLLGHYKAVQGFLEGRTGDSQLAEDLTQETYLRAVRYLDQGEPPRKPLSWLKVIAKNVAAEYYNRLRPAYSLDARPHSEDDHEDHEWEVAAYVGIGPLEQLIVAEDYNQNRRRVSEAVSTLSARDAAVLQGYYLEGKGTKELSLQEGTTQGNVKMMLFRARGRMRQALTLLDKGLLGPGHS